MLALALARGYRSGPFPSPKGGQRFIRHCDHHALISDGQL